MDEIQQQIDAAKDALVNAHEAGDTDAATQLADHITTLQAQLDQQTKPAQTGSPLNLADLAGGAVGANVGVLAGRGVQDAAREMFPSGYRNKPTQAPTPTPAPVVEAASGEQLTGGEKWNKALTGETFPGAEMEKESLDKIKQMKKTVGRGGELAGGTITEGGILVGPKTAATLAKDAQLAQEAAATANAPSLFKQALNAAKGITETPIYKGVGQAIHGVTAPWLPNMAFNALSGYEAGSQGVDAYDRAVNKGQWLRGALSGLGAVGSAAAMTRHPIAAPVGIAAGLVAPQINEYLDKLEKEHPEFFKKYHLAQGGLVSLK